MARLSPAVRKSRSEVQAMIGQVSSLKRRNKALKDEVKESLPPVKVTAFTQLGAVLAGATQAYASPDKIDTFHNIAALALIGGGTFVGSPEAIAAGNGVLAVIVAEKTRGALTKRKSQGPSVVSEAV